MKIVIYGPQGAGKTAVSLRIASENPGHNILDEWDGISDISDNCIALTHEPPPYAIEHDAVIEV